MNVKKTMLFAVAFATAVSTSFAAKTNPDLQTADETEEAAAESAEGRYVAPKSYGWSALAIGLATPVQLPWGIEKWDIFGLDLNLGYSDSMKMYGWEFAFGARHIFAAEQKRAFALPVEQLSFRVVRHLPILLSFFFSSLLALHSLSLILGSGRPVSAAAHFGLG